MNSTVTQKQLDVLDSLDEKYQERMESNIDCILDEQDEELLLTYLRSSNSIIRAGAVDLLRYSNAATTRDTLIDCAKKDPSHIVRSYCCSSLCDIAFERKENDEIIPLLSKAFQKERSLHVKLAWIADLVDFANDEQLETYKNIILKGIRSRNRHNRYLAVKAIQADPRLIHQFGETFLKAAEQKEKCRYIRLELQEIMNTRGRFETTEKVGVKGRN